ncbi:MarR family transcriptional regulator [Amycolatopsis mediterranei S699]|uniref:MarR family transcriptional regulator n=2 Tax=Amycolatopsis mediterranei TaxID=33910 RepID=A0A0H3D8Y4_AMYMU|nr:MarR family winged helix-turn-helix transcriptional regulator [Amycolatopsis mediterranei]ADJ47106.1 MarR family transcriptional regulator [Amycolatopsis mediterranei U32]AEK43924.1 MarR family transcriptional regulator [Amycolatopsis mediterranei S699]AFO78817.1 MarR family transcriptional regulator [Amycolatopsis mediterranei S699]AGT85945.1 MarR family transcriptional regulator [Amycolatopsis mediterranei RB]KDO04550.1 MarR family transcriptional regulator [Amycolatopsis mediterranei]
MTDVDSLLDQIGPALSRLRRRIPASSRDVSRNLVLNVIADVPGEMTVGGLAAEMGVAQPVASRMVAACIADGLLRRAASQADGRRTVLELTEQGEAERTRFAAEQRAAFEEITAGWSPEERTQFARLLVRYTTDAGAWSRRRAEKER